MTGAQVLTKLLNEYEPEHVFGVPGDTSTSLYDAFCRWGEFRHVVFRDERSAVFAADAYARASGGAAVVDVPSGGGALYAVAGISEAQKCCIPVLCIATDIPLSSDETEALTEVDQEALFKAVSKWNARVKTVERLPALLAKAFRLATSGRPGATVLTVPENILNGDLKEPVTCHGSGRGRSFPLYRPRPPRSEVERLVKLLAEAERPIVLAGGGTLSSGAYDDLAALCSETRIPVATSINGKGSVAETSEWAIGVVGANGGRPTANALVAEADLILVLGSKLNRVTTLGGSLTKDKVICQVDVDAEPLDNNAAIDLPVLSDIRELLQALREAVGSVGAPRRNAWRTWCERVREETTRDFDTYFKDRVRASGAPVSAYKLVDALQNTLPQDSIVVADAGTPTPFVSAYYRVRLAGRRVICPRGHGGLGYALPGALGAKLGRPAAAVVGIFGDGSFGMSMGDLETIARVGAPLVLINLDNGCYGWIKVLQKLYFGERYFSVDFSPVDNLGIARSFGLEAHQIDDSGSLEERLEAALRSDRPVFLNVSCVSPVEETPPVAKWLRDEVIPAEERKRMTY